MTDPNQTADDAHQQNSKGKGKRQDTTTQPKPPPSFFGKAAFTATQQLSTLLPSSKTSQQESRPAPGLSSAYTETATYLNPAAGASSSASASGDVLGLGPRHHLHHSRTGETMSEAELFAGPGAVVDRFGHGAGQRRFEIPIESGLGDLQRASPAGQGHARQAHEQEQDGAEVLDFLRTPAYTVSVYSDPPLRTQSLVPDTINHEQVIRATVHDGQEAVAYLRERRYAEDVWGIYEAVTEFQIAKKELEALQDGGEGDVAMSEGRLKTAVARLDLLRRHFANNQ
ncbi:uncharacterized protein EV422DRAFT_528054 [Fimicolochytrium jonesii]|uniref:uncharacterized protein n=1 Tax=Fimicolochytrium jonesii TaxID=1396493 RepID=UPI0022FDB0F7|nr:uncharacterized protein EV422DRAFT_528054 [Fimicolochytrium jonesii]KAI8821409.1 hypothetical protein EV422DRAFT_528054 [Fimicolochytrium jonesii]